MNRNEKESRRKKKREEKQRAARAASRAHSPTSSQQRPPSMEEMERMLAAPAAPISAALAVDPASAAKVAGDAMDRTIAEVWTQSEHKPACGRGCSYCCRGVRVDVSPPELALILEYVSKHVPDEERASMTARAAENAAKTHDATMLGYPPRLPCALLSDSGECLVYDARPLACRNEHSLDVKACEIGYDQQEVGKDSEIEHLFQVSAVGSLQVMGMSKAMRDTGLSAAPLELQEALHIALTNPAAITDWRAGKDPFASARSNQTIEKGAILPGMRPPRLLPTV